MKNLNKKIGVVAISGLVLIGGGLSSSASAFSYQVKDEGCSVINQLEKSPYESKWDSLAQRNVDEKDLQVIINFGSSAGYFGGFKIKAISSKNNKNILVVQYSSPKKVQKYFDNVDKFISHMWSIGMPRGCSYIINVRGVDYHLEFI